METNDLFSVPRGEVLNGQVNTGYDSNVNSYDVTGTANGQRDALAYRLDGAYREGSAYRAGDGTMVPADFLNRQLRAKVGYQLGDNQRLTAGGGYQQQDDVDYPGRLLNAEFFKSGRGRLGYEYASGQGLVRTVEARAYGYQTLHTMNNEGKVTYASEDFPGPPLRVSVLADITTFGGRVATVLGETPTEGYATVDVTGGVEVSRGVSVEGGGTNLTDTDYVNHLNAKNPYFGTPIPEPGRIFFVGVTYQF